MHKKNTKAASNNWNLNGNVWPELFRGKYWTDPDSIEFEVKGVTGQSGL